MSVGIAGGNEMNASSLTTEEARVVGILCDDWRDLLRCTNIHQAMDRAGVSFSHARRIRIAEFLMDDAECAGLMRWAPSTYVLTNDEKLIARRLVRSWRKGAPIPRPRDDEWRQSGRSAEKIEDAFNALAWLRFIQKSGEHYEIAADAESFLQGLGFYFHEVVLTERDERFNTNCAPDFFIMTCPRVRERFNRPSQVASSTAAEGMSDKMVNAVRGVNTGGARALHDHGFYGGQRAVLNDACGWSDKPILVVMDRGELVEVRPETTWYLLGGG
jgi:hypothetical protein